MSAAHTPGHGLTSRTIHVAAVLAERFLNPDVAAYARSHGVGHHRAGRYIRPPSTARREQFWFGVGRALTAAYGGRGMRTDYERDVLRAIEAERAAIAKAEGRS